jgi:hypothetical protein
VLGGACSPHNTRSAVETALLPIVRGAMLTAAVIDRLERHWQAIHFRHYDLAGAAGRG